MYSITEAEHRDEQDWCTRFSSLCPRHFAPLVHLSNALHAINGGRAGGLQDIVRTCQELVADGQLFPNNIKAAQQEMHTGATLSFNLIPGLSYG